MNWGWSCAGEPLVLFCGGGDAGGPDGQGQGEAGEELEFEDVPHRSIEAPGLAAGDPDGGEDAAGLGGCGRLLALFVSQGYGRIDARRAPGGNPAGEQRNEGQQGGRDGECERIARVHAE